MFSKFSRWPLQQILLWALPVLVPLALVCVFFLHPLAAIIGRGLGWELGESASATQPLWTLFTSQRNLQVLSQTLLQAGCATALAVVLGVPTAYFTYCVRFPGVQLLRTLLTVPFVLPTVVVAVAFGSLYGPGGHLYFLGLDQSLTLIVFALAFFNITVVSRTVGAFWAGLDSGQAQAARTLGAGNIRVFVTVTLPQLSGVIASAAALVFLYCTTSFGIVRILGGRKFANVETEIYFSAVQFLDLRTAAVLSILQLCLVVIVLLLQHALRPRGEYAERAPLPPRQFTPVRAGWLSVLLLALGWLQLLPLLSLVWRSFSHDGRFTLANYLQLGVRDRLWGGSVLDAAWLSLQLAGCATLLTMLIAVPVALVISRKPASKFVRRLLQTFDMLLMLPVGASAVILGFGLLITMHAPFGLSVDLRSNGTAILAAQVLVALPLVLRVLTPPLRAVPLTQRETARVLGASELRVVATVDLPALKKPLAVAGGLAFAVACGEFGASSFLVRPGLTTLPVVIGQLAGRPGQSYGVALAASVLLGVICAMVLLVAEYAVSERERG